MIRLQRKFAAVTGIFILVHGCMTVRLIGTAFMSIGSRSSLIVSGIISSWGDMRSYMIRGGTKTYIDCLMADELDTYYSYEGRKWDGWRKDDKHRILYNARINEKQLDIKRMEK